MKDNLEISGKKLEIMSESQIGVTLDDFVLKEQRQAINENVEETLRRQNTRLIKSNRDEDKYDQEGGQTFIITTDAAVWGVCMVKGDRARERSEVEDNGKREKRQAEADRVKKNKNGNDKGDSGGEEEDDVAPSKSNRGRGSGSGSDSDKVGYKRSGAIAKSRRGKRSGDIKNVLKQNSGRHTLQVQGQR